jgi:hypothetical protein
MSQLREALDYLSRVNFRDASPAEAVTIGGWLERAAQEITQREAEVAERERAVSAREAKATMREDEVKDRLRLLTSMGNVRRTLDLKPVAGLRKERLGWLRQR